MENLKSTKDHESIFTIKSANEWLEEAKSMPVPKSLFMEFWFEGELCILFADTNVGKSILAVQIGTEIARTQPVIYFDFELSTQQFAGRYSIEYKDHYNFPPNFRRAEMDPDSVDFQEAGFESVEEFIYDSIKKGIVDHGAKVLIIDNLTYLRTETEKAKEALPLMKYLKELKNEFNLSILALAHTPKRNLASLITRNDLGGSRMLMNFCDSSFAIGESLKGRDIRYLKQIKVRATVIKYDTNNVAVFELCKSKNFLEFVPVRFEHMNTMNNEQEHLQVDFQKERKNMIFKKICDYRSVGKSIREISDLINVSTGSISNYMKSPEFSFIAQSSSCSNGSDVQNVQEKSNIGFYPYTTKPQIIEQSEVQAKHRTYNFTNVKCASIEDIQYDEQLD